MNKTKLQFSTNNTGISIVWQHIFKMSICMAVRRFFANHCRIAANIKINTIKHRKLLTHVNRVTSSNITPKYLVSLYAICDSNSVQLWSCSISTVITVWIFGDQLSYLYMLRLLILLECAILGRGIWTCNEPTSQMITFRQVSTHFA